MGLSSSSQARLAKLIYVPNGMPLSDAKGQHLLQLGAPLMQVRLMVEVAQQLAQQGSAAAGSPG